MKTLLIGLGIAVVVIAGITAVAVFRPGLQSSQPQSTQNLEELDPNGPLAVDAPAHSFGSIAMADGLAEHDFVLTNTSDQAMTLTKLYSSCMCTQAELRHGESQHGPFGMAGHGSIPSFSETLEPGDAATVTAIYDPNAHGPSGIGPFERQVMLEAGDKLLTLTISGEVTP